MGRQSPRKIALGDQVLALLHETRRYLSANEIADRLDEQYPSVYRVLEKLAKHGAIEKVHFIELKIVLWGVAGTTLSLAQQLAEERELRIELLKRIRLADKALTQGDITLAQEHLRGHRA